jgi:hypothetical protein
MARINVNLNEVSDSQFELFPEGIHHVQIQPSTKLKQSDSGPYIQVIAKGMSDDIENKLIGWNCSLLPTALWNLKNMLIAIGMEWDEDGFDLEDLYEQELMIHVTHREYPVGSGEMRNQVEGDYYSVEAEA